MANSVREDVAKLKELRSRAERRPFSYLHEISKGPLVHPEGDYEITLTCSGTVFHFSSLTDMETFFETLCEET